METVITVALIISILVMLILLFSCSNKSHANRYTSRHTHRHAHRHAHDDLDDDLDSREISKYGQGEKNREFRRRTHRVDKLKDYDDYNDVIQYESLDPEVYQSHDEYSKNVGISSNGASALSVTSHDNYPVPFVGLRRPDMQSTYARTGARTEHSEYADQMPGTTNYLI